MCIYVCYFKIKLRVIIINLCMLLDRNFFIVDESRYICDNVCLVILNLYGSQ